MKRKIYPVLLLLAGLWLGSGCGSTPSQENPVLPPDEPASPAVEARYQEAQKLVGQKEFKNAANILKETLTNTKNSAQIEKLMLLLADAYFKLNWNDEAEETYHRYLILFPKTEHLEEVLNRRYEIAQRFINGAKDTFLGLPIVPATDKGIQLMHDILKQYPYAPASEQYRLKLAEYFYQNKDYAEARLEYDAFIQNYANSPAVHQAQFRIAECYLDEYAGPAYDGTVLERAKNEIETYLEKYPTGPLVTEANKLLAEIISRQAQRDFLVGDFYLRTGHPASARVYFQDVINQYPNTPWAQKAKELLPTIKD